MRIKIRKSDTLFSQYLREKRNACKVCGSGKGLQVSHFWGRRHENTRFDEENCDVLCFTCHQHFEENPAEYTEWKKKQLGEKRFKVLMIKANTYCKRDDKMQCIILQELLKNLEN